MLAIRLFRVGKKNQPAFKIVVTDKRRPPRAGRFLEQVGFYNPLTKEKALKGERIKYWISKGAKPSDTVFNLLIKEKILEGKKVAVHKKSKKKEIEEKPVSGKPVEENKQAVEETGKEAMPGKAPPTPSEAKEEHEQN